MTQLGSAEHANQRDRRRALPADSEGLLRGALGVLAFSLTLPATRAAVAELDATFVGLGRALAAALLAALLLAWRREQAPPGRFWPGLAVVACGVVIGFPLLSALALRCLPAAHGAIVVRLAPAATAVVRGGERPSRLFWLARGAGVAAVLGFAAAKGGGAPRDADALLLAAVARGGPGYAEGGRLARELGGWRRRAWPCR